MLLCLDFIGSGITVRASLQLSPDTQTNTQIIRIDVSVTCFTCGTKHCFKFNLKPNTQFISVKVNGWRSNRLYIQILHDSSLFRARNSFFANPLFNIKQLLRQSNTKRISSTPTQKIHLTALNEIKLITYENTSFIGYAPCANVMQFHKQGTRIYGDIY